MIQCDKEDLLITKADFDCIGQVARHCDWDQLCIYIREQQNLTLLPKIGQCLWNMLLCYKKYTDCIDAGGDDTTCQPCGFAGTQEEKDILHELWCGGNYIGCDGTNHVHFGIKRMLVHYAYGAYIYRHGYVDTPFGVVQKMNQDSVPAPMNELRKMMQEHQAAADQYWGMTKEYLCSVKGQPPIKGCMGSYFGCDACCNDIHSKCSCQGYKDYRCDTCCHEKKRNYHDRGIMFGNVSKFDDC